MDEKELHEARLRDYYVETDREKRQDILNAVIGSGYDVESAAKLQELWELRYRATKRGVGDSFLGAFMELYYITDEMDSIFRKKYNMKVIKKALKSLGLGGEHSFPEDMLYKELRHLALCYIAVTRQNGAPRIFGFSLPSKAGYMDKKLKTDLFKVADELPEKAGLQNELAPLARALTDAVKEYLD